MQIHVEQVHFAYPNGVKALNEVSLVIQPGEKVALVGENGSGKSTLARHLNGLLRPDTGQRPGRGLADIRAQPGSDGQAGGVCLSKPGRAVIPPPGVG